MSNHPHASVRSSVAAGSNSAFTVVESYGDTLTQVALYGSLVVIYAWFGGMKFTAYEAEGLVALVSNSPVLNWFYSIFSTRAFSTFLGVLELSVGALIAARLINPAFSALGGLLSAGLFVTTLSFMASTPGVAAPDIGFPAISISVGQFLLKDLGLLAISLWIVADSLKAIRHRYG